MFRVVLKLVKEELHCTVVLSAQWVSTHDVWAVAGINQDLVIQMVASFDLLTHRGCLLIQRPAHIQLQLYIITYVM